MMPSQLEEDRSTHPGGCAGLPMPWDSSSISVSLLMASKTAQERRERDFQKCAGRDRGNTSVKLLGVLNKLDLSNIVVWLGFLSFLAKISGEEHRAVTIL